MKRFRSFFLAAVAAAGFGGVNTALAAPQILAALPVESGIPLTCNNGVCAAELSTYCLQRERPAPGMGTAYVPAAPEHFTLVLTADNGNEVRLPASAHMTFVENRGFMSVAAAIEHGRLNALGAGTAKLVVWKNASLIPVATPHDPNPLTAEEIAYATKSLRDVGREIVDERPAAQAAQLLAKLNAALPAEGAVGAGHFDGMWKQAIGDDLPPLNPVGNAARDAYRECASGASSYGYSGLRRCLEYRHDDMIRGLNVDYWQNQPGS